jgi:hypothetical protein
VSLPDPAPIADAILEEVGEQMGELYSALPDLVSAHCDAWWGMEPGSRRALVQAVAEQLGGPGYEWSGAA